MIRPRSDQNHAPRNSWRPSSDEAEKPASIVVVYSGFKRGSPNTE